MTGIDIVVRPAAPVVLSAFPFNETRMALYAKMGFTRVGIYREQGLMDGKWVDTVIMERLL